MPIIYVCNYIIANGFMQKEFKYHDHSIKKKCLTALAEQPRFARAQITHPDDVAESWWEEEFHCCCMGNSSSVNKNLSSPGNPAVTSGNNTACNLSVRDMHFVYYTRRDLMEWLGV